VFFHVTCQRAAFEMSRSLLGKVPINPLPEGQDRSRMKYTWLYPLMLFKRLWFRRI
jgi:hypothetical protein